MPSCRMLLSKPINGVEKMGFIAPEDLNEPLYWPGSGVTRVPYRIYADPEVYTLEQQRIFRGPVWNLLCLEIEVSNPGDFKTSTIGEIPIVVRE